MSVHGSVALAVAALALSAASAHAQADTFTLPVERFRPAIDDRGLATTEGGGIPSHLAFQGGLIFNYALNPLVLRDGDGDFVAGIIAHRLAANAQFTIGLFDYVSVGVDLPVTLLQLPGSVEGTLREATGLADGLAGIGLGDLRLVPKVRILREDRHFVSLALIPSLTLPTAGGLAFTDTGTRYDYGGSYLGEGPGTFAFIPEVAVSTTLQGFRLAGNLAYRLRQPTRFFGALEINPEFVYRVGAGFDFSTLSKTTDGLLLFTELFGATPDRNPFGLVDQGGTSSAERNVQAVENRLTNPLEWAAGARYVLPFGLRVEGGVGSGILPGYGSPDLRVFLGVRTVNEDTDEDDDGIQNVDDACVREPEDKDAHDDGDGCPDPDNDGDGLPDTADACPNEAEDVDAFQDADGCPELDNDDDRVLDVEDTCPLEPGAMRHLGCPAPDRDGDAIPDEDDSCVDVPGIRELKGCPDRDGDGVPDLEDACPDDAGQVQARGCPDRDGDRVLDKDDRCVDQPGVVELRGCADTDKDGIADPDDTCVTEAETINGIDDADGCPDKGKVLVVVTKERIEIRETVFFDTGKATIQKKSFGLLDQVAQVLKAHPEIKRVRVEGHTDAQGDDASNLELSKRRAESVRAYLEAAGVDGGRIGSEGYGESKPIADNKSKAGRAQNRRVEFMIVEQVEQE